VTRVVSLKIFAVVAGGELERSPVEGPRALESALGHPRHSNGDRLRCIVAPDHGEREGVHSRSKIELAEPEVLDCVGALGGMIVVVMIVVIIVIVIVVVVVVVVILREGRAHEEEE